MKFRPGGRWLVRALGLGLFGWILLTIDVRAAFALLAKANAAIFFAATLLIFPMTWLKNERWRLLLRRLELPDPPRKTFLAYLAGLYLGLITPGRVGDLFRARLLGSAKGTRARAVSSVIWDRVFDVFTLFLVGALVLGPVRGRFGSAFRGALVLTGVSVAALVGIRLASRGLHAAGSRVGSRVPERFRATFLSGWSALVEGCSRLSFRDFALCTLLSLLAWGVYLIQSFAGAACLSLAIPGFSLAASSVFSAVAGFLPISISGVGTRDGALIYAFGSFGHPKEEAVAFSFVILLFLVANAILGALALWRLGGRGGENGG